MNKRIVFRSILLLVGAIPAWGVVCLAQAPAASASARSAVAQKPSSTAASASNATSTLAGASTWGPGTSYKGTGVSSFGTADKSIQKGGTSSFGLSKGSESWSAGGGSFPSSRAEGGVWRSNEGMSASPAESSGTAPSGFEAAPQQHAIGAAASTAATTSTTVTTHSWASGYARTPAPASMARSTHGFGGPSLGHGGPALGHIGSKPGMGKSPIHRTLASARTTGGVQHGRASGIVARHGRTFGSSAETEGSESDAQGSHLGLDTGLGQSGLGLSGTGSGLGSLGGSTRSSGLSGSRLSTGLEGSSGSRSH